MRCNSKTRLLCTAAISVAAFVFCFVLAGSTNQTYAAPDKKAYAKGYKALRKGDYEQAEKVFRELLNKDAHDVEARLGLSFTLLKQRSLQGAYDNAARVIMTDPLSARGHALLGAAILGAGEFRLSVEEFRTALALNENEAMAVAGLAMVDFYENRLSLAVPALRRAASLDPEEPDYVFNLGQAAARSERYKEAADAYEKFLLVAPKTDADRRARILGLIDFLRYLGRQGSLYIASGENRTSVSFEATDNRPVLEVRVNGQRQPLRFVLDTGSGMSVISEETAKRLNIRPVARGGLARAVGGGGRFEIVYGYVNSLEIGAVKVENVPVYIRKFFDNTVPVDGYLGLSVVAKFLTAIDYGTRRMSLVRQNQTELVEPWTMVRRPDGMQSLAPALPTEGMVEVPLRTTSSGFLSGEVGLEGFEKTVNFIIDTAASITVVSEKLSQEEQLLDLLQPSRMRVFGAAGVTEDVKLLQLPRLSLGLTKLERINAAVLDMEPVNETAGFTQSGILGGNFLRHFRVYFDFARGAMRLETLNQKSKSATENINPEAVSSVP
ncbi:MAG TPA: aspartyl protease family protein [Pyrinomonadaceae bacterium]|nr:aspartyl protease family protein [Pyrinomonadaceae bacterium]